MFYISTFPSVSDVTVMRVLVLLSVLVSTSHQICFPDEDLRECYLRQNAAKATTEKTTTTTTNKTPVETIVKTLLETRGGPRRSLISGRYCFSTRGYSGHCQFPQDCPDRSYSYSRNCGWKHICCKDAVTKKATQRPTRTPTVRLTARPPVKPPVKRPFSPSETCGVGVTDLIFCGGGRNCTAGKEVSGAARYEMLTLSAGRRGTVPLHGLLCLHSPEQPGELLWRGSHLPAPRPHRRPLLQQRQDQALAAGTGRRQDRPERHNRDGGGGEPGQYCQN